MATISSTESASKVSTASKPTTPRAESSEPKTSEPRDRVTFSEPIEAARAQGLATIVMDKVVEDLPAEDREALGQLEYRSQGLADLPVEQREAEIRDLVPGLDAEGAKRWAEKAADPVMGDLVRDMVYSESARSFADQNLGQAVPEGMDARTALRADGFTPEQISSPEMAEILDRLNPEGGSAVIPRHDMLALGDLAEARGTAALGLAGFYPQFWDLDSAQTLPAERRQEIEAQVRARNDQAQQRYLQQLGLKP